MSASSNDPVLRADQPQVTKLKVAIWDAGLLDADVVRGTGINQATISMYVRGKRVPTSADLLLLMKFFQMNSEDLIGFADNVKVLG